MVGRQDFLAGSQARGPQMRITSLNSPAGPLGKSSADWPEMKWGDFLRGPNGDMEYTQVRGESQNLGAGVGEAERGEFRS